MTKTVEILGQYIERELAKLAAAGLEPTGTATEVRAGRWRIELRECEPRTIELIKIVGNGVDRFDPKPEDSDHE